MKKFSSFAKAGAPSTSRRRLLWALFAPAAGAWAATTTHAKGMIKSLKTKGEVLKQEVWQGEPPVEPLDTMIHFRRSDNSEGRAITHEILSLTHEEKGSSSYPWTIYAHLDTHHVTGDACVLCSRLHKYGPGWSTGLHSEVFNHNRAVALGLNVEMSNDYAGKEATAVHGINVQAISSSPQACDVGLNIHGDGGFKRAINIESKGEVAIDINGTYKTGIDLHGKELRLGKDGSIALDERGDVRVRLKDNVIEFIKDGRRAAHIRLDGDDRAL